MKDTENTGAVQERKVEHVSHSNIFAALAALQMEMPVIERTAKVSFTTRGGEKVEFTYSPLGEMTKVLLPLLGKNGLSFRHEISGEGIACIITHETAEQKEVKEFTEAENGVTKEKFKTVTTNELRSGIIPIAVKGDMKDIGANITYARRYSLAMVLGIASEEDKDVEFIEARREQAEKYAFTTAKTGIEKAKPTELPAKIEFLRKELEKVQKGELPSLGLSAEQYEQLIKIGEGRTERKVEVDEPAA